jgi:hypothetical protein
MIEAALDGGVPARWVAGVVGLGQHQVRRWDFWYRWTTLALAAHALLAVFTAVHRRAGSTPDGLIALTRNEISI